MKKVFISGVFNVVHPGHLRLFKFAKSLGQKLIVGVYSDKFLKNNFMLNYKLRIENLKANNLIDEVILVDSKIENIIKKIKPNYIIKGKEHENRKNIEKKILDTYGGELIFSSGDPSLVAYEFLEKKLFNKKYTSLPQDYLSRHKISISALKKKIENFKTLKVCVIGDVIIDEYIDCKYLGMSQESPSLVVSPFSKTKFLGGAGIVAAHCSKLGANVDLITVVGDDQQQNFVRKKTKEYKINLIDFVDSTRPTSLKERYIAEKKTLLKVSNLSHESISNSLQNRIYTSFKKKIKKYDLVIFSDFNYGIFTEKFSKRLIDLLKKKKCIITADSQSSSQIGDITKFKNIDLITPTEYESRIAMRNNNDGLVVLAKDLIKKTKSKYVIIKLGEDGVIIQSNKKVQNLITDRLLPFNQLPIDISGAGDSMLAGASLSLACKFNIWESILIGNILASIQISRLGNVPINFKELLKNII